jgi:hypothetical protein
LKIRLFEFEDLPWFPEVIRSGGTDYLRYILELSRLYEPVSGPLSEAIERTGSQSILDLCSGGGGPILQVQSGISKKLNNNIPVRLSDKYPNIEAFRHMAKESGSIIGFETESIDATAVPPGKEGFRTIFSGIHHFDEPMVKAVLKNAVEARQGIGIFDGGDRNILTILGILIFHPIGFLILTPFLRPFRWSRLLFTYVLPLIPLYTIWDGVISILRLYSPGQLLKLANETGHTDYEWKAGKLKSRFGMRVTYLMGYPKN